MSEFRRKRLTKKLRKLEIELIKTGVTTTDLSYEWGYENVYEPDPIRLAVLQKKIEYVKEDLRTTLTDRMM